MVPVCSGCVEVLIAVNKRKNGDIHLTTEEKQDISHLAKKKKTTKKRNYKLKEIYRTSLQWLC